jgi:hypothetical protein
MSCAAVSCAGLVLAVAQLVILFYFQLPVVQRTHDSEIDAAVNAAFRPFLNRRSFTEDELLGVWRSLENICIYRITASGLGVSIVSHAGWGCLEFRDFVRASLWRHGAVRPRLLFAFNRLDEPRIIAFDDAVRNGGMPPVGSTWDSASFATRQRFPHASASGANMLDLVVRKAQLLNLSTDVDAMRDLTHHPFLFAPPGGRRLSHVSVPLFSMAGVRDGIFEDIVVPDIYYASFARDHPHMVSVEGDSAFAAKKQNSLYWRGSTTGGAISIETMESFPRVRAVREAHRFCNSTARLACDTHFTAVIQAVGPVDAAFAADSVLRTVGDRVIEPFKHSFVLDVDGNSFSARLVSFLVSRSVVVRLVSGVTQFFTRWLRPDYHFHAVALDASNMSAVLERIASQNSTVHEQMSARASLFARRYLSLDFSSRYMHALLTKMSTIVS